MLLTPKEIKECRHVTQDLPSLFGDTLSGIILDKDYDGRVYLGLKIKDLATGESRLLWILSNQDCTELTATNYEPGFNSETLDGVGTKAWNYFPQ